MSCGKLIDDTPNRRLSEGTVIPARRPVPLRQPHLRGRMALWHTPSNFGPRTASWSRGHVLPGRLGRDRRGHQTVHSCKGRSRRTLGLRTLTPRRSVSCCKIFTRVLREAVYCSERPLNTDFCLQRSYSLQRSASAPSSCISTRDSRPTIAAVRRSAPGAPVVLDRRPIPAEFDKARTERRA